ncbi:hypothetical protein BDR04DRAFT_1090097 [Suillus decipiens]|nr:hypothetical protein BDR04DRAFT_1090097 [Suillus decipiens]
MKYISTDKHAIPVLLDLDHRARPKPHQGKKIHQPSKARLLKLFSPIVIIWKVIFCLGWR